ncbi:MAG: helix-turn-helix transcriptional regulator [Candidatus Dormibacteraceae bacterium]
MALARVLCPTLIGRDSELSTLEDALLSALRGDGGVVVVGGEAGMGKTRLVNTLAGRARRLNCVVLSGGCSEAELALPYLPFLEAIGNYLETANIAALRERLGTATEELAQLFPQMGRPAFSSGDASQAKLRLFESMLLLLRDAAGPRALLFILEDLQWADPATRELLDYATRRLRSTNVLIVGTYRSDELHRKHALLPTIQGWRRAGQVELVELQPLGAPRVADMVCAIFDEGSVTEEFRDFLHERSEGNPFVLEEMLRDALDRGDIFRTDNGWDRKSLLEIRIPRTVKEAILQRLERLSRDQVTVLSAASAVGRSFDLSTLAAVAGVEESSVLLALEASVTAQLLEEEDRTTGHYRFRHALTREAIYEDMVVPRRRQLHSRVADVLASRRERVPVDQANHLLMAGRYDEAVAMCAAAADDAIRTHAYRDAAELLERAAPHEPNHIERARMLCRASDAYWNNSESANAKRLLEQGIADLEAAGLDVEAAGHRVLLGRCWWELMRSDLAEEQFEQARQVLESAGPSESLAIAYVRLAGLAMFRGDLNPSLKYANRAVAIADMAGASLARAWALIFLAGAECGLGQVEAAFSHTEESYQASIVGGYRFQVGNAVYNATWEALHLGLVDKLATWFARSQTAGETADARPQYLGGLVGLEQGRVVAAIDLARVANQRNREAGFQKMVWRSSVLLAHALAENMRPDEAASVLPPLSTRVDSQDALYDTSPRVRVRLAAGDVTGAAEDAKTVRPQGCPLASPVDAVSEAVNDAAWLRSFIGALPVKGEVAASPRLALGNGRLALLEGRYQDAIDLLVKADTDFRRGGLLLDAWHLGRALAEAQFRVGDIEAAQNRLRTIIAEAEPAGALLAAKLARDTAVALGLEVPPAADTARPAERSDRVAPGERMVSVMFADVRGYTELSGSSAPAEMAARIASLQRWASQEVTKHHGLVDKFAGDAVMATFNVSGQRVDHTLHSLQAAIAIIDKASLAGLPVGAGIAVGPAVVGTLAESANLSVLGEVTNMAARLQAQSAAGEVTLSEEAHRRVQSWLEERHIKAERLELRLKGFEGPVVAFRAVTGAIAATPS